MADNYWMDREKKWLEKRQFSDEELASKIDAHYRKAISDIDKQISNFYVNYASDNKLTMADAKKKVANFDVQNFSSNAAKMVADKDFSKEANEKLQLYNSTMKINRLEMLKAQTGLALTEMDDGIYRDVNMHLTTSYRNEVKRQAGILGDQKLDNVSKKTDQVVNASFNGAKWSDRIWVAHDELKGTLDGIISRAMIQGTNPATLKSRLYPLIDKTVKNRSYVAKRIAVTETARVEDVAQMESFKASGFEYCVWIASINACEECADIAAYHDGIYPLSKVPNIPVHPSCRCSKSASMGPKDKELEKVAKADTSEDNISNKFENSNMKHVFGDKFYNDFTKTINSPEFDPRLRGAISKYADKYKFHRSSNSSLGNSFGFNVVNLTDEAFIGNSYKEPLESVFHEIGHAMDHFSMKSVIGADKIKTGRIVKRKVAASMMKVEEKTQYLSSAGKYDLTELIHGDLDKAVYGDIPDVASLGRRPRKPDLAKEYRLKRMDLLNKRAKAQKNFINNIKADIKSGKDESKYCTLSDMLESTGNFDVAPLGYGHGGKKYWSNYERTSTEFVAEMTESLAKDPEKLKIMEKYMPNAAKKYYELLDTISNG